MPTTLQPAQTKISSNFRLEWLKDSSIRTLRGYRRPIGMKTGIKLLTTIDGPIAAHRNKHAALRLQNADGGMCHPVWAGWWGLLKPDLRPPVLCKFLQSPVKEEESDSQNLDEILLLPVNAFEERN